MTPEEFQRYKEAEKAHLRKLKELKKAVHTLERQKTLRSAVEKVADGQNLLDKQKDLVDELALDTARHEARLDIALESSADAENEARSEMLEEELQRERAQALVRQLKREMGNDATGTETPERQRPAAEQPDPTVRRRSEGSTNAMEDRIAAENPTEGRDDRPEKTIGRM